MTNLERREGKGRKLGPFRRHMDPVACAGQGIGLYFVTLTRMAVTSHLPPAHCLGSLPFPAPFLEPGIQV